MRGYNTGGCLHFVINNQIGFTTSPQFARSSPYPSDVAKGVQAPIIHVNGDDPEAVTFACKLAIEFRQRFKRDIVIDMWCYRRFGHNEGDEPSFTQPLMYQAISQHPRVSEIYAARLIAEGVIDDEAAQTMRDEFDAHARSEFDAAPSYKANEADWFGGRWSGLNKPADPETARRNVDDRGRAQAVREPGPHADHGSRGPDDPQDARRVIEAKRRCSRPARGSTGRPPRRSRSAAWSPKGSGSACRARIRPRHVQPAPRRSGSTRPTSTSTSRSASCRTASSRSTTARCREYGVLGFEYGFAGADPKTLVLWEAQFGDFANGAQIIIDQFIAAGEAKWLRANGLVLLLPHGFEGQGPEHSSARLERFLQLCANDNMQVCNITSPANYFHVLRRQMLRPFRKPLVIMTPKSLLRHPMAKSSADEFIGDEPLQAHPRPTAWTSPTTRSAGWCCAAARSPTT